MWESSYWKGVNYSWNLAYFLVYEIYGIGRLVGAKPSSYVPSSENAHGVFQVNSRMRFPRKISQSIYCFCQFLLVKLQKKQIFWHTISNLHSLLQVTIEHLKAFIPYEP